VEANNLVAEVITDITAAQPNFQQIINKLREAVTKITSEAATVAKELKF
jgi:vacuolar-type H+-ATPase subunit H